MQSVMIPQGGGHANHRRHIHDFDGVLDVIAVVSNPVRYRSRYDLYRSFERHMADSKVRLTTVECAFGDRAFEVTNTSNPRHVQLRSSTELWNKENLINIGVSRLPLDWQYVAWIDADVQFARPDWAQETMHILQHHPIIQIFSHPIDLGPDHAPLDPFAGAKPASWAYCYRNNINSIYNIPKAHSIQNDGHYTIQNAKSTGSGLYWHPGFAWACRRDAWDAIGGLLDFCIVGSADYIMACAITGHLKLEEGLNSNYVQWILEWQERAQKHLKGDLGYVDGTLLHYFHGVKKKRGYNTRGKILIENGFDPVLDLKRDWQGLWTLTDRSRAIRDDLRAYFRSRDEDGTS